MASPIVGGGLFIAGQQTGNQAYTIAGQVLLTFSLVVVIVALPILGARSVYKARLTPSRI